MIAKKYEDRNICKLRTNTGFTYRVQIRRNNLMVSKHFLSIEEARKFRDAQAPVRFQQRLSKIQLKNEIDNLQMQIDILTKNIKELHGYNKNKKL